MSFTDIATNINTSMCPCFGADPMELLTFRYHMDCELCERELLSLAWCEACRTSVRIDCILEGREYVERAEEAWHGVKPEEVPFETYGSANRPASMFPATTATWGSRAASR